MNNASNAVRASLELRGPWPLLAGEGGGAEGDESRATVTRGAKSVQSFALSFIGILTGIGFRHWKRVEGSKCEHCLQQCNGVLHFGQVPLKSTPGGSAVEQL